jgi:hypothetical protein
MAALSPAEVAWPIDPTRSWRRKAARNFRDRNCDPRSVWTTQPATSKPSIRRLATAELRASTVELRV